MKRVRGIITGLVLVGCSLLPHLPAQAQAAPGQQFRTVLVDGLTLGRSVILQSGPRPEAFIPLAELRSAIDGGGPATRLLLRERTLLARDTGSCAGCPLRVRRAVLISGGVRLHDGAPHVPLHDVARALDAAIHEADGTVTLVTAGCEWCILAPVQPSP